MSERLTETLGAVSRVTTVVAAVVMVGGWLPAIAMTFVSGHAHGYLGTDAFFWEGVSFVPLGVAIAFWVVASITVSVEISMRLRRLQRTTHR